MTWLDCGSFRPMLIVRRAASRGTMMRVCKSNCFVLAYCGLQRLAVHVNMQLLHVIMSSCHYVVIIIIVINSFLSVGFGTRIGTSRAAVTGCSVAFVVYFGGGSLATLQRSKRGLVLPADWCAHPSLVKHSCRNSVGGLAVDPESLTVLCRHCLHAISPSCLHW